jgi:signal transduction histidine kinase
VPGIVIVEDEYIVALDIRSFLERSGYQVAGVFASGEDLLARLDDLKPDLILMDIKIRGELDGVETARIVHERRHVPVLLLTAYADDETVARAKITQPFGYILKPFEERELRTAIEIALYRAGMEAKLRESEERFRRLFTEGISGNFLADAEGRVTDANPAFLGLVGARPGDEPPSLDRLFRDRAAWESFRTGLFSARRLELVELPLRSVDGKEILVLANAALLLDADGGVSGIQGELTDTTERRRLEERLLQAQKMEAIGRLAGGIAHDFNNILTAVLGYANLLGEELPDLGEAREDLEGIKKAAARASNLTRQLLAFSRRQPATPRIVDLNALIQDTERMLARLISDDVSLGLDLRAIPASVLADPVQIEQILLNLVVNAKDAMPDGGSILITTRSESLPAPRSVGLDTLAPGDYVVLDVCDTGQGIALGIVDRIFEPFFTTKPKEKGTGLGLSTVYGIAKQSGGAVGVESKPGAGADFSVWLPLVPGVGSIEEREEEASPMADAVPGATILFVDDDESLRALVARQLVRRGYRVLVAANAGEALLIAESYGRPIDLLVTDAVMPLMDGYSLARRVETLIPTIGVLVVSGQPERSTALSDGVAAGRNFLAKPFSEAELAAAVAETLVARVRSK